MDEKKELAELVTETIKHLPKEDVARILGFAEGVRAGEKTREEKPA